MFTCKTRGSCAAAVSHITEAKIMLISAQEYIFGLTNMAGDPFAPCEESKRNTDLLSKAKVVTFH
jgi:hypothetical protein